MAETLAGTLGIVTLIKVVGFLLSSVHVFLTLSSCWSKVFLLLRHLFVFSLPGESRILIFIEIIGRFFVTLEIIILLSLGTRISLLASIIKLDLRLVRLTSLLVVSVINILTKASGKGTLRGLLAIISLISAELNLRIVGLIRSLVISVINILIQTLSESISWSLLVLVIVAVSLVKLDLRLVRLGGFLMVSVIDIVIHALSKHRSRCHSISARKPVVLLSSIANRELRVTSRRIMHFRRRSSSVRPKLSLLYRLLTRNMVLPRRPLVSECVIER